MAEDFDIKQSTTCGRNDNKYSGIELGMVMINLHSVPGTSKSGWKSGRPLTVGTYGTTVSNYSRNLKFIP